MNRDRGRKRQPRTATWLASFTVLLIAAGHAECGDDQDRRDAGGVLDYHNVPPDYHVYKYDTGYIPRWDQGVTPKNDQGSKADGQSKDSQASCPGPGATCSPKSSSGELCTAACGGTCGKVVTITGAAHQEKTYVAMAEAIATCWEGADGWKKKLCYTFDSCKMTGSLQEQKVVDWICKAADGKFPSQKIAKEAKYVLGCSVLHMDRLYWQANPILAGSKGTVCLRYKYGTLKDILELDKCANLKAP